MVINGRARQSCSALVDDLLVATGGNTITLEPMSKFPNVRDLKVDRTQMFDNLKKLKRGLSLTDLMILAPDANVAGGSS